MTRLSNLGDHLIGLIGRRHQMPLANQMVTEVRQRVTGADHLSAKRWTRLGRMLDNADPTNQIGAAWGVKNASPCSSANPNRQRSGGG